MITLRIQQDLESKSMLRHRKSMIFLIILVTFQTLMIIDNKVILFIKPTDMAHKTFQNNMIIPKTQLVPASKFMLNTISHTTLETFQTLKITDSKVIPFIKQMDMVLRTSLSNTIIPKILLDLENKFTHKLRKSTIFHIILAIFLTLMTIDNKVILYTKPMDMAPRTLPSNMTTPKILLDLENKFMHRLTKSMIYLIILVTFQMSMIIDSKVTPFTKQMAMVLKISLSNTITLKILQALVNKFMLKRKTFHKMQETYQTLKIISNKEM